MLSSLIMTSSSPRFAFIDLDGTLYRWSLYIDLIDQLMRFQRRMPAHLFESQTQRRAWEAQALNDDVYLSQHIHGWEERAIMGLSDTELTLAVNEVLRKPKSRAYIFTRELITVLKTCGYRVIALGGSPQVTVEALAKTWGFDEWYGSEYVKDPLRVYGRDQSKAKKLDVEKEEIVRGLLEQGALRDGSIAVGDTASDWTILKQVEHPIAFNPEQGLYLKARQTGVPVIWERKNVIAVYRTRPHELGVRADAFLFHEVSWSDALPTDVAEPLMQRLRALDQSVLSE